MFELLRTVFKNSVIVCCHSHQSQRLLSNIGNSILASVEIQTFYLQSYQTCVTTTSQLTHL